MNVFLKRDISGFRRVFDQLDWERVVVIVGKLWNSMNEAERKWCAIYVARRAVEEADKRDVGDVLERFLGNISVTISEFKREEKELLASMLKRILLELEGYAKGDRDSAMAVRWILFYIRKFFVYNDRFALKLKDILDALDDGRLKAVYMSQINAGLPFRMWTGFRSEDERATAKILERIISGFVFERSFLEDVGFFLENYSRIGDGDYKRIVALQFNRIMPVLLKETVSKKMGLRDVDDLLSVDRGLVPMIIYYRFSSIWRRVFMFTKLYLERYGEIPVLADPDILKKASVWDETAYMVASSLLIEKKRAGGAGSWSVLSRFENVLDKYSSHCITGDRKYCIFETEIDPDHPFYRQISARNQLLLPKFICIDVYENEWDLQKRVFFVGLMKPRKPGKKPRYESGLTFVIHPDREDFLILKKEDRLIGRFVEGYINLGNSYVEKHIDTLEHVIKLDDKYPSLFKRIYSSNRSG